MTEPMIERVARAISDAEEENPRDYNVMRRAQARAAVKEMQNPTRSMLRAAAKAMLPEYRPTPERVPCKEKHRIRYRAMIDAALSEDLQ